MPSKKTLKKRNRKLCDRYENMYSKFQHAGAEAWEAGQARDKAVRDLRRIQTAARELVHALDDGRQDDIPQRKDTVRDLLPGEPWTLSRVIRMRDKFRSMSNYPWALARDDRVDPTPPSVVYSSDWAKIINNDTYRGFRIDENGIPRPIVHNHGSEDGPGLACRETRQADGTLRGECMRDAA